jgi:hypothetical protein
MWHVWERRRYHHSLNGMADEFVNELLHCVNNCLRLEITFRLWERWLWFCSIDEGFEGGYGLQFARASCDLQWPVSGA